MAFDFLGNLTQLGFFDLILPWTLFFAIVYGLLRKVDIFKNDKLDIVISIALAFFGVNYTAVGADVGLFLTNLFGVGGLVLSAVLLILLVAQLAAGEKLQTLLEFKKDNWLKNITLLGLVLLVVGVGAFFVSGKGASLPTLGFSGISSDLITTVLILIVMLGVIWFVVSSTPPGTNPPGPTPPSHP